MMEIVKVMAGGKFKSKRTIPFAAWGAKEEGLIGSDYYVYDDRNYPFSMTIPVGIVGDHIYRPFERGKSRTVFVY